MKKSKFLIPFASIAALGATVAPMILATSCGNKVTNVKIAASSDFTLFQSESVIKKSYINVVVYKSDNTSEFVTNWTCDKFVNDQYTVTPEDERNGSVTFVIKYDNMVTTKTFTVSDVTSITATYKAGSNVYRGTQISKEDIEVIATKKSGATTTLGTNDWTCTKLSSSEPYMVTEDDEKLGKVEFEIKYLNLQPYALSIDVAAIQRCGFLTESVTLFQTTGAIEQKFSSLKEVYLYAFGGLNPQRVSAGNFTFKYFEDTTEIPDSPVSVKEVNGTYAFYINKESYQWPSSKHIVKAYLKGGDTALAEIEIKIAADQYTAYFRSDNTADLTLAPGMASTEDTLIVPEYLQNDSKIYTVTGLKKQDSLIGIRNLIIPKTVTYIEAHLFDHKAESVENSALENITFMGSEEAWNDIDAGDNWQGDLAMGAYMFEDAKYVQFANRLESDFVKSSATFDNQQTFVATNTIGSVSSDEYVVKFDLDEIIDATGKNNYQKFKYIEVINPGISFTKVEVLSVYINGKYINKGGEESATVQGYFIINDYYDDVMIKFTDAITLHPTDVITVRVKTPSFSSGISVGLHTNKTWEE